MSFMVAEKQVCKRKEKLLHLLPMYPTYFSVQVDQFHFIGIEDDLRGVYNTRFAFFLCPV